MHKGIKYKFTSIIWTYKGPGAWHFVSLPVRVSKEIRSFSKPLEEGWGRLKAVAKIGSTEWNTAVWFDTKQNTYILPIKANVRKTEKLQSGQNILVYIWV